MVKYQIKITLKSDTLVGLGEGYGTIIDTDIVIDDVGLPYIPAKRIKGIMLESAEELNEMLKVFDKRININELFGISGEKEGVLHLSNFFIEEYENVKTWLRYYIEKSILVNKQNITDQMTSLKYSTAINSKKGLADEHSLRTERVINKGNIFLADVDLPIEYENSMSLICQNIRRIGTKRTRGLGEINAVLMKDEKLLNYNVISQIDEEAI
jgi:CRISPR-associated protein Csx10